MGTCGSAPKDHYYTKKPNNPPRYIQPNPNTYRPRNIVATQQRKVDRISLAAQVIEKCGFSAASEINKATLLAALQKIQPSGSTALRDAMALSTSKMLALKVVLTKLGLGGHQFIHIVLTDGSDNSSKTTLRDMQGMYYKIGREIGDKFFKTFFIGVGLERTAQQQLQSIANLAGNSAQLFSCNDVQLSDVFERIKFSLGIQRKVAVATNGRYIVAAKRDQLVVEAQRQKFLVLFDLDMSGSMSGMRWTRLQYALSGFFKALGRADIIGCVLFNDKCVCLTGAILNNATA